MRFVIPGKPIAQARPRLARKGRAFNCQKKEKDFVRCIIQQQMANKRILRLFKGPISFDATFYTSTPSSWSQKRRKSVFGNWDTSRPDIDNFEKFAIDAFSGVLFEDDNQVCETYCRKKYAEKPRTEVYINLFGEEMITEHAITSKQALTLADIEYLVKKANRIGMNGRKVVGVTMSEDEEGAHYFFECDEIRAKND